jgi:hypothetical protein
MIKKFADEIQKSSQELLDIKFDKNGLLKEEVDIFAGNKNYAQSEMSLITSTSKQRAPDVWYNFYEKIREAKIVNKKLMDVDLPDLNNSEKIFNNTLDEIMTKPIFTVEENKGKCLDMHEIYLIYQNIKKVY